MRVKINEDKHRAEIWLTRKENSDDNAAAKVRELINEFRSKKLFVVVFRSGADDIAERTGMLLRNNIS
ncbi:MAG: hypothetical protein IK093_06100 [Ruminiclostridium sp.]|nr:hypothetical protein [Ruminiclostridium sp.]